MSAQRILLIQLRELGDTLLATPLLRQLARLHPKAEIDVLCQDTNACILANNLHVTGVGLLPREASTAYFVRLAARLRRRRYDMVIDAQSLSKTAILSWLSGASLRFGFHRRWRHLAYNHPYRIGKAEYSALSKLRLLQDDRVDLDDLAMEFPVDREAKREAEAFRRRWFQRPVAAIFGVGRLAYRNWPVEKFAQIGDRLAQCGFQPWLIYGDGQAEAARRISELMRFPALVDYPALSFPALKEVIAACDLMVTNDGGPKHLATLVETPCVTVYSDSLMATYWNPPKRADMRVVTTRCKAASHVIEGTYTDAEALVDVPVDAVWGEVEQLVDRGFVGKPVRAA
jgi:ADP-heptose:LPS heptosyltransferase